MCEDRTGGVCVSVVSIMYNVVCTVCMYDMDGYVVCCGCGSYVCGVYVLGMCVPGHAMLVCIYTYPMYTHMSSSVLNILTYLSHLVKYYCIIFTCL